MKLANSISNLKGKSEMFHLYYQEGCVILYMFTILNFKYCEMWLLRSTLVKESKLGNLTATRQVKSFLICLVTKKTK